jgi:hypothetical protein
MKVKTPEFVRMSPIAMEIFFNHVAQRRILDLQMELVVWKDLVKQIDPNHNYVWSKEYQAFMKIEVEGEEEENLDRHKGLASTAVIDGSFRPGGGA